MKNQEALAEIVADMHELANDIAAGRAIVGQTVWRNYADRIEAAAKRERGNAAAMREALGMIRAGLWNNTVIAGKKKFALYEIADAALAKPPRNCDLYGGDYKMLHTAWFDWTASPSGMNPDGTVKLTFAEWLLEIAEVHHA